MAKSLEAGAFRRGPGGRPTRAEAERRHRLLLETAKRLLLERGWDGTSIDEISRQSGVAKRFLYTRYPDKATLFVAALEQFRTDRIATLELPHPPPEDVEEALVLLGRRLLDMALSDEALAVLRLFTAESERFRELGELAKAAFERNKREGPGAIVPLFDAYVARGVLTFDDPYLTAEFFFALVAGLPQRRALLFGREPPEQEEQRLRAAIKLFLDGCRRR